MIMRVLESDRAYSFSRPLICDVNLLRLVTTIFLIVVQALIVLWKWSRKLNLIAHTPNTDHLYLLFTKYSLTFLSSDLLIAEYSIITLLCVVNLVRSKDPEFPFIFHDSICFIRSEMLFFDFMILAYLVFELFLDLSLLLARRY